MSCYREGNKLNMCWRRPDLQICLASRVLGHGRFGAQEMGKLFGKHKHARVCCRQSLGGQVAK
jgi:hypothetical protein